MARVEDGWVDLTDQAPTDDRRVMPLFHPPEDVVVAFSELEYARVAGPLPQSGRLMLASELPLTDQVVAACVTDPSPVVREQLASNRACPTPVLEVLTLDHEAHVAAEAEQMLYRRRGVPAASIESPHALDEFVSLACHRLESDPAGVAEAAAAAFGLTRDQVALLVLAAERTGRRAELVKALLENPSLDAETVSDLSADFDVGILGVVAAAHHPNAPSELLVAASEWIQAEVFTNRNCPAGLVAEVAAAGHLSEISMPAAAASPNLGRDDVDALVDAVEESLESDDEAVRHAAEGSLCALTLNPAVPDPVVARLAVDHLAGAGPVPVHDPVLSTFAASGRTPAEVVAELPIASLCGEGDLLKALTKLCTGHREAGDLLRHAARLGLARLESADTLGALVDEVEHDG